MQVDKNPSKRSNNISVLEDVMIFSNLLSDKISGG